jgi:hypothetical protein
VISSGTEVVLDYGLQSYWTDMARMVRDQEILNGFKKEASNYQDDITLIDEDSSSAHLVIDGIAWDCESLVTPLSKGLSFAEAQFDESDEKQLPFFIRTCQIGVKRPC